MSEEQAIRVARRKARETGETYFVVWVPEDKACDVANEIDLDTFYCGTPDRHILFCSDDDE